MKLYGIKTCDTVRKALKLLQQQGIEVEFIDVRTQGFPCEQLPHWCQQVDWQTLVNKKSPTWRSLDAASQALAAEPTLAQLFSQHPTLMKRPVLDTGTQVIVGFDAQQYQQLGS